jgi:hypothetical protein
MAAEEDVAAKRDFSVVARDYGLLYDLLEHRLDALGLFERRILHPLRTKYEAVRKLYEPIRMFYDQYEAVRKRNLNI